MDLPTDFVPCCFNFIMARTRTRASSWVNKFKEGVRRLYDASQRSLIESVLPWSKPDTIPSLAKRLLPSFHVAYWILFDVYICSRTRCLWNLNRRAAEDIIQTVRLVHVVSFEAPLCTHEYLLHVFSSLVEKHSLILWHYRYLLPWGLDDGRESAS